MKLYLSWLAAFYLLGYLEENKVPDFTGKDNSFVFNYAKNNNLDRNAVWIGSKFRSMLHIVNEYKDKKLGDISSNDSDQPFNGGLSSLELIMYRNWHENFERLYKFLHDTRAFG